MDEEVQDEPLGQVVVEKDKKKSLILLVIVLVVVVVGAGIYFLLGEEFEIPVEQGQSDFSSTEVERSDLNTEQSQPLEQDLSEQEDAIASLSGPGGVLLTVEKGDVFVAEQQGGFPDLSVEQERLVTIDSSGEKHLVYQTPKVDKAFYLEGVSLEGATFSPSGKYSRVRIQGYEWSWMIVFETETGEIIFGKDDDLSIGAYSEVWSSDDVLLAFLTGSDYGPGFPYGVYFMNLSERKVTTITTAENEGIHPYLIGFSELRFIDADTLAFEYDDFGKEVKTQYTYRISTQELLREELPLSI